MIDPEGKLIAIQASLDRAVHVLDFWSVPQEEVVVTAGAGDKALPDVVAVGIPAGATIHRVIAMFKFRIVENTNVGANALDGAQEIQVKEAAGAWIDAINLVDDMFSLAASTREGGDVMIGALDVKAQVDDNDTYNFQWDEALADLANIQFNDVQTGLRVFFRIG